MTAGRLLLVALLAALAGGCAGLGHQMIRIEAPGGLGAVEYHWGMPSNEGAARQDENRPANAPAAPAAPDQH